MGRKHYKHRAPTLKLQCVIFGGPSPEWEGRCWDCLHQGWLDTTQTITILKLRYFSSIVFVVFFPFLQMKLCARNQRRSTVLTVLIKMWLQIAFRCSTLGKLTLAHTLAQEWPNSTVDLSNSYAVRDLLGISWLESALRKSIWRGLGRKGTFIHLKVTHCSFKPPETIQPNVCSWSWPQRWEWIHQEQRLALCTPVGGEHAHRHRGMRKERRKREHRLEEVWRFGML